MERAASATPAWMSAAFAQIYDLAQLEGPVAATGVAVAARAARANGGAGRALDLACGAGTTARLLRAAGWHTTGIDSIPTLLEIARARMRTAGVRDARIIEADLCAPPVSLRRQRFDLVLCLGERVASVNEISVLRALCGIAAHVLKPGGWFACDAPSPSQLAHEAREPVVLYDTHDLLLLRSAVRYPSSLGAMRRYLWFVRELNTWWREEFLQPLRAWTDRELRGTLLASGFTRVTRTKNPNGTGALYLARI